MKTLARVAGLLSLSAFPLVAQETPAEAKPVKWGFGVMVSPMALLLDDSFGFLPLGLSNFLIPIRANENLIVEPEVGVFRTSSDAGGESSFSSLRLGVGLLMGMTERGGLKPYAGPRFGVSRTTSESTFGATTTTTKQTNWSFSGVVGAQHFFSPHFSLGGEIQLTRTAVGDEETTPAPPASPSSSTSFITTTGIVTLRWFF